MMQPNMIWRLLHRKVSPVLLLLSLTLVVAHAEAPPATTAASAPLTVTGLGNSTVPLGGKWQLHLGDDPSWASPALDDSGWEPIAVDKSWGAQTHFNYTGYAWYRRHIDFVPVIGAMPDIGLLLPPVQDVYEVYWNGTRIAGFGKFPPWPSWRYSALPQTLGLGKPHAGVLAIRVWQAPYVSFGTGDGGGLLATPLAGSMDTIATLKTRSDYRWLESRQFSFGLDTLYGLVALLGLLGWSRNRKQLAIFWMSLFAGSHVMALFIDGLRLPMSFEFAIGILQPVLALQDVSLWFLLLYLLELEHHRFLPQLTRVLAWVAVISGSLDGLLSVFDTSAASYRYAQGADFAFTLITTVVQTLPLFLIPFAFRKHLGAARWLVAGFAFLTQLIFELRVAAAQGERFTHWTLAVTIGKPLFTLNHNPFSANTLASTCLLIAIVYGVYRYSVEQSERQGALEQEYKSAQELQRVLIPDALPSLPGYAVTSAYQPAQQVGGDFFQLITQKDGSALLVLGDVSGKGLKAAMTVSLIVGTLRTLAEQSNDPAEILAGLNRRLHGRLQIGFVTCVVLRLDDEGGCVLANAGHPAPFLNRHEIATPGALPLGLDLGSRYETTKAQLAVGDRLTLYTDGLLEARNSAGELYGFDRLRALFSVAPDAKQATDAAVAFGQDDDITVLTLTRLALGAESTTSLQAPRLVLAN
jgi:hypothetical protein